jgi:cupin fold WbuC family metalloprotein
MMMPADPQRASPDDMSDLQIIDRDLLDHVSRLAEESPRRRKNYNFHVADSEASHRLLNAMEPDSYIPPHCHADASKDETIVVLRGALGAVFFNHDGSVARKAVLQPNGEAVAVNVPHGVFHTLVALEPATVFFEAKAGPYLPLREDERGAWAPREGDSAAAAYLAFLRGLFAAAAQPAHSASIRWKPV